MEAPHRYSVSPFYSFVTVPVQRSPPLAETVGALWRWVTGRQPKPTQRERQLAEAVIERLVAEMDEEPGPTVEGERR